MYSATLVEYSITLLTWPLYMVSRLGKVWRDTTKGLFPCSKATTLRLTQRGIPTCHRIPSLWQLCSYNCYLQFYRYCMETGSSATEFAPTSDPRTLAQSYTLSLFKPINLQSRTSLECGRKAEHLEKTHMATGRMDKLCTDGTRSPDQHWSLAL